MKLLDGYLPVFKLAAQFAYQPENFADYESFRALCITRLEEGVLEAEHHEISDFERDQAFFAIIVWLDENILCSPHSFAQNWRTDLLQRKYFNISIGGEIFFTRLNQLKEEHLQAREVFLFCLQSGFHGRYNTAHEHSTLTSLVARERQKCLPEDWLTWPTAASITPINIRKRSLVSSSKNNLILAVQGIAVIYAATVLLQILYFS